MGNIVTLTSPIAIDTDETCEVTIAALESKITALGDSYFADSANWSSIQVEYRSATGRQREVVIIKDIITPTSSGTFRVSAQARQEGWTIHEIRVKDFDGDFYAVKKADMIAADYTEEPTIDSGVVVNSYPFTTDMTGATFGTYDSAQIEGFTPVLVTPSNSKLLFNGNPFEYYSPSLIGTGTHYVFRSDEYLTINPSTQTIQINYTVDDIDLGSDVELMIVVQAASGVVPLLVEGTIGGGGIQQHNINGQSGTLSSGSLSSLPNVGDVFIVVRSNFTSTLNFSLTSITINVV
jgi:hypothetical protein